MSALMEKKSLSGRLIILRDVVSSAPIALDKTATVSAGSFSDSSCALRVVSLDASDLME